METFYYPVIVVENAEELEVVTGYCEEYKIIFQFLDNDLNSFPAHVLLYCSKDDLRMFTETL